MKGKEDSKIYLCKYQVSNLIVMKNDEKIEFDPSNIIGIEYMNDYEFNFMALLKVSLQIDTSRRLWILKNKREIKVKFELNRIGMDIDTEEFITSPEALWNIDFQAHFNDDDESSDADIMEERVELNEGEAYDPINLEKENYFESQNTIDIYLLHPKLLKGSRVSYNQIFNNTTLQNAIGAMLTSTGHTNVLMSKFENDEVYEELIIPINPVYKCMMYLDQNYGFYRKGAVIYYDIDTLYILNSNGEVTAKKENEWVETSFMISSLDESIPGNGMIRTEGERIFYPTISELDINPQKFSISKNAELGSEAKIVVTGDTTVDIHEADQSFIGQRNETIAFVQSENKYIGDITKARMEENECVLYINAQNLDISAFTPNKTFRVVFYDTTKHEKYGKYTYRLAYAYHAIKPESSGYMTSTHMIVLKKTKGPTVASNDNG